jgi:hypothetical protein
MISQLMWPYRRRPKGEAGRRGRQDKMDPDYSI